MIWAAGLATRFMWWWARKLESLLEVSGKIVYTGQALFGALTFLLAQVDTTPLPSTPRYADPCVHLGLHRDMARSKSQIDSKTLD